MKISVLSTALALSAILASCGGDLPPSAPTELKAYAVSDTRIDLLWNESSDDIEVSSYKVYRGGTYIKLSVTNSASDTGLSTLTYYCYTVSASDTSGNESDQSEEACATTLAEPDTTPPSAPANLVANVLSSTEIELTWSASTDNVRVAGYNVYRGGAVVNTVTVTSYPDVDLTPDTYYCYTVSAFDAAGNESGHSLQECENTLSASLKTEF